MSGGSSSRYLSLIDAGISNLWSLSLPPHLESLNLHGNLIRHISNISHLRQLVHLDLSANQISSIDNLEGCVCLRTLNLSCNLITVVEGLSSLRCLERLDLSYNQIRDIQGVVAVPSVKHLSLHGNKLDDINFMIQVLSKCRNLCHLIVSQDGSTNPICSHPDYESKLRQNLPHLVTLNSTDVSGQGLTDNSLSNIPGLEAYLDFLLCSNDTDKSTTQQSPSKSPVSLLTPKIDAVMEQFKQRYTTTATSPQSHTTGNSSSSSEFIRHTENMKKILSTGSRSSPTQGACLLSSDEEYAGDKPVRDRDVSNQRRQAKKLSGGNSARTGRAGSGGRSNSRERKNSAKPKSLTSNSKKSISKSPIASTSSSKHQQHYHPSSPPSASSSTTKWRSGKGGSTVTFVEAADGDGGHGDVRLTAAAAAAAAAAAFSSSLNSSDEHPRAGKMARSTSAAGMRTHFDVGGDVRKRADLEAGYKDLLSNLQDEKERRWKAEQAARKMADLLQDVHAKHKSSDDLRSSALEAVSHLKQTILEEHQSNQRLKEELTQLKSELESTRDRLGQAEREADRGMQTLKVAESTLARRDGEEVVEKAHQTKKLQEANQKASAMTREAELLRHALDATKHKVEQLQETLASREQQHREDMRTRYCLNSPELQEVIGVKVKEVERQQQGELGRQQERVEQLSRQYTELENEFRQALTMEEARFREIKFELDTSNSENLESKQLLLAAQRKDETSTNIIAELSALVKEQKGRITELAKVKQEQNFTHKDRVEKLEETIDDMRRQLSQLESAKQAKSKLQATVQAQESVIEGLKAERRLWGHELAQQGAALAQDRGRLESRVETFTSEIAMLKKQLEREADAVKIKTKMVEDQTETIRRLKEAVLERETTIKETRTDCLSSQKELEDQVTELKAALEDSRDVMDRSSARKEELKQRVAELETELHDSKNNHSTLSARWKEKSELIGRLEQQVTQMRNNWSEKEAKLSAERDMALQQAKQAVDKLKSADMAFRQQLDVKEAATQDKLKQAETEKQQELELANRKVELVEEEMRDLLRENEATKRAMEGKMKKLTQALGDLQSDLL